MNIYTFKVLFPDIVPGRDFKLVDHSDGKGVQVEEWNYHLPQPDQTAIDGAAAQAAVLERRAAIPPVTRRQMLTALEMQHLLDAVEAYVAGSPKLVQIAYRESNDFERTNPFLNAAAPLLGKTDDDLDALFALAKTL